MAQHRKFEDSLLEFDLNLVDDDPESQDETVSNLLDFLVNWLINHIQKVDMLYVK